MHNLFETLLPGDLHDLVSHIFEVDSYASKMGNDEDIVVLSFKVDTHEAAEDLVNFIEQGYSFVLDADSTPGELNNGKYRVFVEIERNRRIASQIEELLVGLRNLTGLERFKFRYYKSFHSMLADEETMASVIPGTKQDYQSTINENLTNNFSNFFNRSYLESIDVDDDNITFQKKYAEPLRMKIKDFGLAEDVFKNHPGKIMIETSAMSEVMYMTKYIGNYNINKVGNDFVLEHGKHALVLTKV